MFKALPTGSLIADHSASIVALYRSTNTRSIALGLSGEQVARAWVVGAMTRANQYRVWVYLGGDDSTAGAGLLFRCDPERVSVNDYGSLIEAARSLVTGHGFGMQKQNIGMMDADTRESLLAALPIDPRAVANTEASVERVAAPRPSGIPRTTQGDHGRAETSTAGPTSAVPALPNRGSDPPRGGPPSLPPPPVAEAPAMMPAETWAKPVEISREISLPAQEAVDVLGRLLLLF